MKRKYELTISTNYVPDWTYIEAFRELFQNALDNETTNPENKMYFEYKWDTINVINKTSVLGIETLLLGSTTKREDKNVIGKHGEGYKIAFMVLLREGKTIKVYNYGKREIWEAKLVKSKRYNNQLVTVITVETEAIWKSVPNNNLTIAVGNVTENEFEQIVKKNLHLQKDDVKRVDVDKFGGILTSQEERGNIYVNGLYVSNNKDLRYGYDFKPSVISLDRDRKMVDSFNLLWTTSAMLKIAMGNGDLVEEIKRMILGGSTDVKYVVENKGYSYNVESKISDEIAKAFLEENGEDAVPVENTVDLELVKDAGKRPVIVNASAAHYIRNSSSYVTVSMPTKKTLREQLEKWVDSVEHKLSDDELTEINRLIQKVRD